MKMKSWHPSFQMVGVGAIVIATIPLPDMQGAVGWQGVEIDIKRGIAVDKGHTNPHPAGFLAPLGLNNGIDCFATLIRCGGKALLLGNLSVAHLLSSLLLM